jgi:AraC-like DNA-binding protein
LIYVFRGTGVLHASAPYPFKAGCAYLLPPRTPHREEAGAPMDTLWIGLRGSCLGAARRHEPTCAECPSLAPLLEQLWLRADRRFGLIGPELDGLARAALGRFVRALEERHPREQDLLDQAAAYLHQNFSSAVSIADLAARFGFSEGYFYRAFKRRTGMTPVTYLTQVRIENAQKLLRHSSLKVSRVARLVGYQDPLYFSRIFRKVTGQSPRAGRLGSRD